MLYLATASTGPVREAMRAGLLGQMSQPNVGNRLEPGVKWAADNGCFNAKWSADRWQAWLTVQPLTDCLFAVVPDVVADADATRKRWVEWSPTVRDLGFPTAYVLQNGETCPPWDDLDCLFVGGDDTYKLSTDAQAFTAEANRRGKWTHMGRVNSLRRLKLAIADGYDSVDGTFLAFGPDLNLPRLLRYLRLAHEPRLTFTGEPS